MSWADAVSLSDSVDRRGGAPQGAGGDRYQTLFEAANDAIFVHGIASDGMPRRFLDVNGVACRRLGYSREELLRLSPVDLDAEGTAGAVPAVMSRLLQQGHLVFETEHVARDGRRIPVEVSSRVFALEGEPAVVSIARDLSGRRRAEERLEGRDVPVQRSSVERLQQSEARFRSLIEGAPHGVVVCAEGRVVYANPAAVALFGAHCPDALLGSHILERVHPDSHGMVEARINRVRDDLRAVPPSDLRFVRTDGVAFDVEASAVPTTFEGGPAALLFFRDISARKDLELRFLQAQKMEAVGQLAGGIAHDFNNILTAILVQVGLLQDRAGADASTRAALEELESHARKAADLTRQLLAFSRRSVMKVRPTNLNQVLAGLHKLLARIVGEHIRLELRCEDALAPIDADAVMLEQVVMNLAVNARDAMPAGGRLTLETSSVRIESVGPGDFVRLSVADTGRGMSSQVLARLFEPFFTTKEPGKGTGLGLTTAHGIVKQHGGWIEVDSAVGRGSTFSVFFPASRKLPAQERAPQPPRARGGTETILLVEDDPFVRKLASRALALHGYSIVEACNGREALAVWERRATGIDLVITDLIMPEGMTGLDLLRRLWADRPGLKAILSTGYGMESAHATGCSDLRYLPKPFRADQLVATVRCCLDGEPDGQGEG